MKIALELNLVQVILCDLELLQVHGNVARYTFQCALPLNELYARIFFMLWV